MSIAQKKLFAAEKKLNIERGKPVDNHRIAELVLAGGTSASIKALAEDILKGETESGGEVEVASEPGRKRKAKAGASPDKNTQGNGQGRTANGPTQAEKRSKVCCSLSDRLRPVLTCVATGCYVANP